jgi:putative glutamine amidotransferase
MGRSIRIAVTGATKGSRSAWYFSRFLLGIHGAKPFFIHPDAYGADRAFDALLITGGSDIDPAIYGGEPHPAIERTDPKRDALELSLIKRAHEEQLPLMGICRGMQLINLYFGGTLHPHIHDFELENTHSHTPLPRKEVMLEDDSRLHALLGQHRLLVNALHHQAVDCPGVGMRAVAFDRNKIVQAVEHTELPFVFGLQWHPEFMPYAWHSRKLFSAFVHAAKLQAKGAKPL